MICGSACLAMDCLLGSLMQPQKPLGPGDHYRNLVVWQKAATLATEVFNQRIVMRLQDADPLGSMAVEKASLVAGYIAESTFAPDRESAVGCLYSARGSLAALESLLDVAGEVEIVRPAYGPAFESAIAEVRRLLDDAVRMREQHKNGRPGPDSGRLRP